MTTPGISIALCTYNGAQFLDQQLASLFGQTLPPNEIVICDDGSTDNTIAIIQQWQQQHPGIIRLYQNAQNLGFGLNFKQAIEYCTQDLIFLSDQDDVWLPEKIAEMSSWLQAHPRCDGLFCNGLLMDEHNQIQPTTIWDATYGHASLSHELPPAHFFPWLCFNNNFIIGASMAIRRTAVPGIFNSWLPDEPWHDFIIALKLSLNGTLAATDAQLMYYRQHSSQTCGLQGHFQRSHTIAFARLCWQQQWQGLNMQEVVRYFAFGLSNMERYRLLLVKTTAEQMQFQQGYAIALAKLKMATQHWLAPMPWWRRKKKLLKHYLKGGEYLRTNLADVLSM